LKDSNWHEVHFNTGMSVNLKQIKAIISNYKLMAKGLLANFLIVPIVAWILAQLIPIEESISTGFLLVSVFAGAALGPKLAQKSRSDVPFAIYLRAMFTRARRRQQLLYQNTSKFGTIGANIEHLI
jgi:predicted Na+-dependent transporter